MPVTHPPAGHWTSPGTAQTTAQFLHQCMSHSDSSLAWVRRVVTLSCWNEVVLAYTPWSSTPLQCGHLTGQPVSLTQHFFVEFLQGTANVCECVHPSWWLYKRISSSCSPVFLNKSCMITFQCLHLRLQALWKVSSMLICSGTPLIVLQSYVLLDITIGRYLPYKRFLASQTPCVGPRHHSQPAWC